MLAVLEFTMVELPLQTGTVCQQIRAAAGGEVIPEIRKRCAAAVGNHNGEIGSHIVAGVAAVTRGLAGDDRSRVGK